MIIDSHHHLWRYSSSEYGWIGPEMAALRRDFQADEWGRVLQAAGVAGSVAVQARQSVEETQTLLELAREHLFIRGVVGWVPLADARVGALLDRLAANPRLKGVRHVVQDERDPAFLEGADFNRGLSEVAKRGLVYDLLITARQLPAAIPLVDRHPGLRFVLDHIAKPVVDGTPDATWARHLQELGRRPNVACKFSGVVTEAPGWNWTVESVRPYFEIALAAFTPERLMFGSDWPVCLLASGYEQWLACATALAGALSDAERARFFGGTAAQFYHLAS